MSTGFRDKEISVPVEDVNEQDAEFEEQFAWLDTSDKFGTEQSENYG